MRVKTVSKPLLPGIVIFLVLTWWIISEFKKATYNLKNEYQDS